MKRRILALEQSIDKMGDDMAKKDKKIEELKNRVQYMELEFENRHLC